MKKTLNILIIIIVINACKNPNSENNIAPPENMVLVKGGRLFYVQYGDTINRIIKDFLIDRHEVSVKQFRDFVDSTNYITDIEKNNYSIILKNGKQVYEKDIDWRYDEYE